MSDGEIKMLAKVSESTFTRLYRELAALPERKRVKRLLVLAQIGQIAEMSAPGHQVLPASDVAPPPAPRAPAAAAPAAVVTPTPQVTHQAPEAPLKASPSVPPVVVPTLAPEPRPASEEPSVGQENSGGTIEAEGRPSTPLSPPPQVDQLEEGAQSPRRNIQRRAISGFKVDLTGSS